ncbi:MAG: hypothetical protein BWY66_00790 [bacterium ADurb.Bin374]|nr:MAG: hypothetical protein BWY66_00790 [bacterium ADurb.Bin374]
MPGLTLTIENKPNCIIVRLDGYLEGETGQQLQQLLEGLLCRGTRGLVLDFAKCTGINSLGVSCLLEIVIRIVEDFGGKLVLVGLNELQRRVMVLSGIIPMAISAPNIDEACRVAGGVDGGSGGDR